MAKMHTPAMEKIEKKNRKRKKPVNSTPAYEGATKPLSSDLLL